MSQSDISSSRLFSLDALRGLIMVLMAIDHANYFVAQSHFYEYWGLPLPQHTDVLSFFTRFVTHLCAPGFFFLMGVGIVLLAESRRRLNWSVNKIQWYLVKRGLLLMVIQHFLENPVWLLGPVSEAAIRPGGGGEVLFFFGVLNGLGAALCVCALLLTAPSALLLGLTLITVLATNLLMPGSEQVGYQFHPLLRWAFIPGQSGIIHVLYPFIPWLGLTCFGLLFGRWISRDAPAAYRRSTIIGAGLIGLFLILRITDWFGNIHPYDHSGWLMFLNLTKYPPSATFLCLMLGIILLLLGGFSRVDTLFSSDRTPLIVFGQTALFFYIAHLYILGVMGLFVPPGGTSLPIMYLFWFIGLVLLYFLCRWYRAFKRGKSPDSFWRFF